MMTLTFIVALGKAIIDSYRWPFKNHTTGFIIAGILILIICSIYKEVYPIFLFNVFFNPFLNIIRGLDIFYIGDTAWTDKQLKRIFGDKAGIIWIGLNLILTVVSAIIF